MALAIAFLPSPRGGEGEEDKSPSPPAPLPRGERGERRGKRRSDHTSIFHGSRMGRLSILLASSLSERILAGSHLKDLPVRSEMTPM
jgi:hypothetical protein